MCFKDAHYQLRTSVYTKHVRSKRPWASNIWWYFPSTVFLSRSIFGWLFTAVSLSVLCEWRKNIDPRLSENNDTWAYQASSRNAGIDSSWRACKHSATWGVSLPMGERASWYRQKPDTDNYSTGAMSFEDDKGKTILFQFRPHSYRYCSVRKERVSTDLHMNETMSRIRIWLYWENGSRRVRGDWV